MSNTNTKKVILVGTGMGTAVAAARLLIESMDNEPMTLDEQLPEAHYLRVHPYECPVMLKYNMNESWAEMNKGKLSKRQRRK